MRQIKFLFGVAPGSEFVREIDGVGTFFHHEHFTNTDAPENLDAAMEAITTLEVTVMTSKNDKAPFQEAMSCSSDLLKSEVRYFTTFGVQ